MFNWCLLVTTHMRLLPRDMNGTVLQVAARVKSTDVLVAQFSSVGSMGGKENKKWPAQLTTSMCGGKVSNKPSLSLVFPSARDVAQSYYGYSAGGSIPHSMKTFEKQKYMQDMCHRWKCEYAMRTLAAPHIKSYCCWDPETKLLRWFLLSSANFSKAAWGTRAHYAPPAFSSLREGPDARPCPVTGARVTPVSVPFQESAAETLPPTYMLTCVLPIFTRRPQLH